jgi:hypothetical protein
MRRRRKTSDPGADYQVLNGLRHRLSPKAWWTKRIAAARSAFVPARRGWASCPNPAPEIPKRAMRLIFAAMAGFQSPSVTPNLPHVC